MIIDRNVEISFYARSKAQRGKNKRLLDLVVKILQQGKLLSSVDDPS